MANAKTLNRPAVAATEKLSAPAADPLVGGGMHWMYGDDLVKWQGRVIAAFGDGYYLVQLYSWVMGEPTEQIVVHISTCAVSGHETKGRPVFYETPEEMNFAYEHRHAHQAKWVRQEKAAAEARLARDRGGERGGEG